MQQPVYSMILPAAQRRYSHTVLFTYWNWCPTCMDMNTYTASHTIFNIILEYTIPLVANNDGHMQHLIQICTLE